uniref:Uncharacterized protein n=1 Tax=Anguilla anguilla TaxID=7936 RepID=A0A0E9XK84_ANGAN
MLHQPMFIFLCNLCLNGIFVSLHFTRKYWLTFPLTSVLFSIEIVSLKCLEYTTTSSA